MIMGRRTFDSLPAPLPGRRHIVLTRDTGWTATGVAAAHSVADALALAGDDATVIGGAEIYALLLPRADRIQLTEVHAAPAGDTVVPAFVGWRETARADHPAQADLARLFVRDAGSVATGALRRRLGAFPSPPPLPIAAGMMRLDGGASVPASLRGGIVALGNFRRLSPGSPGGGRAGRSIARAPRARRQSSRRSIRTRCAISAPARRHSV